MALRKEEQGLESASLEGAKSDQPTVKAKGKGEARHGEHAQEVGKDSPREARTAVGEGTAPLTILNNRGIIVKAQVPSHGKGMLQVGNPGHDGSGTGRPKKLTRESLTDAAGEAAESYRELRDKWLELAKQALAKGDTGEADRCQKAADRIQGAYLQYGVGSKVTHVIDKPEWVAQTGRAFDWAADSLGIDPQDAARLRKLMFKRMDEALE